MKRHDTWRITYRTSFSEFGVSYALSSLPFCPSLAVVGQTKRLYIDGLVQERRNSIANALELCLSCTKPSILYIQPYSPGLLHRNGGNYTFTLSSAKIISVYNIEARTKWLPFCREYFQMHFINTNVLISVIILSTLVAKYPVDKSVLIQVMAPNRWQVIAWIYFDQDLWHYGRGYESINKVNPLSPVVSVIPLSQI